MLKIFWIPEKRKLSKISYTLGQLGPTLLNYLCKTVNLKLVSNCIKKIKTYKIQVYLSTCQLIKSHVRNQILNFNYKEHNNSN